MDKFCLVINEEGSPQPVKAYSIQIQVRGMRHMVGIDGPRCSSSDEGIDEKNAIA